MNLQKNRISRHSDRLTINGIYIIILIIRILIIRTDESMKFHYLLMADYTMQQKLLMRRLKDAGLSSGQPKVLAYLSEHDGASQAEIARACFLEAPTMTSTIDGMVRQGLVERKRDNRRTYQVWLTERGSELAARVNDAFLALEKEIFAGIGEENGEALRALLAQVYDVLEQRYLSQNPNSFGTAGDAQ